MRRSIRLYQVIKDGKSGERRFGFIDKRGKLVIGFDRLPKTTRAVGEFHEGRAWIYLRREASESVGSRGYKLGYIDERGRIAIEPRFDSARDFHEGLAYVRRQGFRGFIDREGREVIKVDELIKADDPQAKDFHEGLAAVGTRELEGRWGYIDRSGRLVVKPQYTFADDFSEGLAGVEIDKEKYGFINRQGEMVIAPRFLPRKAGFYIATIATSRFSEGLACVRLGESGYGYIDRKGEFVIPPQFKRAQQFSEGLAWVVAGDEKKVGWIDKSGRWVVTQARGRNFSYEFKQLLLIYKEELHDWRYSEGLVPFIIDSGAGYLWGYMDQNGEVVIKPGAFNRVGPFKDGLARISFDGKAGETYGYIDRSGHLVWPSK
ncbi:MAG TPA: WG repeat-containing protein [Pyrinomonadaceae bacterium]